MMLPEVRRGEWIVVDHWGPAVFPADCAEAHALVGPGIERVRGWGCRMVSPGYTNATDWDLCFSERDAWRTLLTTYGDDIGDDEVRYSILVHALGPDDFGMLERAETMSVCIPRAHLLEVEGLVDIGRITEHGRRTLEWWRDHGKATEKSTMLQLRREASG